MEDIEEIELKDPFLPIFETRKIALTEHSDWECWLFGVVGTIGGIRLVPLKGDEPNWFWRWMQYLILGNKWVKRK